MNADRVEGLLRQLKGQVMQIWGRITGDKAMVLRGKTASFAGEAQASFGRAMGAGWGFGLRRRHGV